MGELERKPAREHKPATGLLGYLTKTDVVVTVAAVAAGILLFKPGNGNSADARMAIAAAVGLVTLAAALYLIAKYRRTRAVWDFLRDIQRRDPEHLGDAAWLSDLQEFVDTFDGLTPQDRARLHDRYDSVWSGGHDDLREAVELLAYKVRRLTPAVQAELARLDASPCGATEAALALLTRDLIVVRAFHQLTEAWSAAKLPLPGGDVPETWHTRLYVLPPDAAVAARYEHRFAAPGSGWELHSTANVLAESGDPAAVFAAGLARNLPDDITSGRWMLRVWPGRYDSDTEPAGRPVAEVGPQPALPAAAGGR